MTDITDGLAVKDDPSTTKTDGEPSEVEIRIVLRPARLVGSLGATKPLKSLNMMAPSFGFGCWRQLFGDKS